MARKIEQGENMHDFCEREYCAYTNNDFAVGVYREDYRVKLNEEWVNRSVYHVVVINPSTNLVVKPVRTYKRRTNAIKRAHTTRKEIEERGL